MNIRLATIDDAPFVAWVIVTAIGMENPDEVILSSVTEMCRREDVLYSWNNTLIAEEDGRPIGALTCYDGARYAALRAVTFPIIARNSGKDFSDMEMETGPGEFYLDSMAVLPECRNRGVATTLLKAGMARAQQLHIPKVCMVVSPENPNAQRLYESLGFVFERDMFLFGEEYRKMGRKIGE